MGLEVCHAGPCKPLQYGINPAIRHVEGDDALFGVNGHRLMASGVDELPNR